MDIDARPQVAPLVWAVPAVAAAAAVAAFVLHARNAAVAGDVRELYLADVWVALVMPAAGAWLWTRPALRPAAVVLLLQAVLAVTGLGAQWAVYDASDGVLTNVGAVAAWVAAWTWPVYLLLPTLAILLFPTGRPVGRVGRVLCVAALGAALLAAVASMVAPGTGVDGAVANPAGLDQFPWLATVASACGAVTFLLLVPATAVHAAVRARRGIPGDVRLGGLAVAAVVVAVTGVVTGGLPYPWNDVVTAAALSAVPVAILTSVNAGDLRRDARRDHERIVTAREEERRRVRQDLHDGLGPHLAGVTLQLSALDDGTLPAPASDALAEARRRLRQSVAEVRRIVDGLRPPALDELGLVEAVRAQALGWAAPDQRVDVRVDGASWRGGLPAAVEVAAYRIAAEALANAARHSGASTVTVAMGRDDDGLRLRVTDDGVGGAVSRAGGLGLPGMRARAEELGGSCMLRTEAGHGTVVDVVLPIPAGPAS